MSKKQFHPKVSIIIPVYNGSNYLREAIDSALAQTYDNFEVIVVNDGSNDNGKTEKICKSYGNKIRYIKKENGGVASALNRGIKEMKGEYFSWLSHDDVYYPNKIEKQINFLKTQEDKKTILYSSYDFINQDGIIEKTMRLSKENSFESLNNRFYPFFKLLLNGCTMLINKELLIEQGGFDESLRTTQDYDLWYKILKKNDIRYIDSPLIQSRIHPQQESRKNISTHIKECDNFWKKIFQETTLKEKQLSFGNELNFYEKTFQTFFYKTHYKMTPIMIFNKLLNIKTQNNTQNKKEILKYFKDLLELESILEDLYKIKISYSNTLPTISFFTGNWHDRGGLNRVISIISSALIKFFNVNIFCFKEPNNQEGYSLNKKINFIEIDRKDFSKLPFLLKLSKTDVFIGSNNCWIPLLELYDEIINFKIKTIAWNHEHYLYPFIEKDLKKISEVRQKVYQKIDALVWLTPSSTILGKLINLRSFNIANPLSLELGDPSRKPNIEPVLISVARFNSKNKRLDLLLKVFAKISKEIPNAKLYVVGPYNLNMTTANKKCISSLIKDLGINKKNLIFTGEVKKVERFFKKASINLVTSDMEGFCLTIIEAANYKIPSIVLGSLGAGELVKNNITGYIISDRDIEKMSDKTIHLLKNPKILKNYGEAAYKNSKQYNLEEITQQWVWLINRILSIDVLSTNSIEKDIKKAPTIINEILKNFNKIIISQIKENEDLRDVLIGKERRISSIENSTSWKLTKPFRIISTKIKNVKRKISS
jgi:hypothetical protein